MKRSVLCAVLVLGLAGFWGVADSAAANTWTVCASGCDFTAIQPAIDAASAGDTILIGAGDYTGGLSITKSLRLIGAGAAVTRIRGGGTVVTISRLGAEGPRVLIDRVTIRDGTTGVNNLARLVMTNSVVTNNRNEVSGLAAGIQTGLDFQLRNTLVSNNRTLLGTCGGISADGTFSYEKGRFLIENSTIRENEPCGIQLFAGAFTLRNTSVSRNRGTGLIEGGIVQPGGILAYFVEAELSGMNVSDNAGTGIANFILDLVFSNLSISDSTITGNRTDLSGGGVMSELNATTSIRSSTIGGNRAALDGGGLWGFFAAGISETKITQNTAGRYGGGLAGGGTISTSRIEHNVAGTDGGGIWNAFGVTLSSSIVNNNIPNNCVNASIPPPFGPAC